MGDTFKKTFRPIVCIVFIVTIFALCQVLLLNKYMHYMNVYYMYEYVYRYVCFKK